MSGTTIQASIDQVYQSHSTSQEEIAETKSSAAEAQDTNRAALDTSSQLDSSAPEGRYGWVVVSGCSVLLWWGIGVMYTWGIYQAALVKEQEVPYTTLTFVGSLCPSFLAIQAIPNARIVRSIGPRVTGMIGQFFLALGCLLSSVTTHHVGGLFVTYGVLCGIGASLGFMAVSASIPQWFKAKRGVANGIIYAAGGLGGAVLSIALDALIKAVGVPWTFRIQGFLILATGLPSALTLKTRYPIPPTRLVEWSLFRDPKFTLLFASGAITTFPLFVPPFFLPLYTNALSLPSSAGAGLVAGFNFASALGRLGCGYSCDVMGSLNTLFLTLVLNAVTMLVMWPLSDSVAPLIPFVILNGIANGGFFAIMPTIVGNLFGSSRVSVAMGMIVTGWLGGYLLGAPIAGFILNATGDDSDIQSYRPAIFWAGSMAAISAILAGVARILVSRALNKV